MTREQIGVCACIASHTGITKKKIIEEAENFLKLAELSSVIELAENIKLRFAVSKETLPIGKILVLKTFEKSALYSDILHFTANAYIDVVAFYERGTLLAAYGASEYTGLGGVFVRSPNSTTGIVVEPLKNYLGVNYPRYSED